MDTRIERIKMLRNLNALGCLKEFDVALAICVSFERMKIWIFGALSLTSIGVGESLLKLGASLELLGKIWRRKESLVAFFKTSRYDFAIKKDQSGPKKIRSGKVEFQIFFTVAG